MTVLTTRRVARAPAPPAASPAPTGKLPIVIDLPRGGVFEGERRRGSAAATVADARDTVLRAMEPLVGAPFAPTPPADAIAMADAAAARVRALAASAVARFRARVGTAARDAEGAARIAIEDWALVLRVDQARLLDRVLARLSPQDLAAAAVGGRHAAADAVERKVASLVELHLLDLLRSEPHLSETTRARLLLSLAAASG